MQLKIKREHRSSKMETQVFVNICHIDIDGKKKKKADSVHISSGWNWNSLVGLTGIYKPHWQLLTLEISTLVYFQVSQRKVNQDIKNIFVQESSLEQQDQL